MQSQFKLLGPRKSLVVGRDCKITREPWPIFDVKGGGLVLGNHVTISSGVNILTHTHQFDCINWRELGEVKNSNPTKIGDYVFIGVNAIIMHSCKSVGAHSVIGAGAVVTKNVPDREVWVGNPARCVKKMKETL